MKLLAKATKERDKLDGKVKAALAKCGDEPSSGELRSVVGVHLMKSAHNPDSINVDVCNPPKLNKNLCWATRCDYFGTNAFGAKVKNGGSYWVTKTSVLKAGK